MSRREEVRQLLEQAGIYAHKELVDFVLETMVTPEEIEAAKAIVGRSIAAKIVSDSLNYKRKGVKHSARVVAGGGVDVWVLLDGHSEDQAMRLIGRLGDASWRARQSLNKHAKYFRRTGRNVDVARSKAFRTPAIPQQPQSDDGLNELLLRVLEEEAS